MRCWDSNVRCNNVLTLQHEHHIHLKNGRNGNPFLLSQIKSCQVPGISGSMLDWLAQCLLLLLRSSATSLGFTILVRFSRMWPFLNPTIEVVTFHLRGWYILGVFLLLAFTCLQHECQDLLSTCDGMHVRTDKTLVYAFIRKCFWGMESEPMFTPSEKSPLPQKFSTEEDWTCHAASSINLFLCFRPLYFCYPHTHPLTYMYTHTHTHWCVHTFPILWLSAAYRSFLLVKGGGGGTGKFDTGIKIRESNKSVLTGR